MYISYDVQIPLDAPYMYLTCWIARSTKATYKMYPLSAQQGGGSTFCVNLQSSKPILELQLLDNGKVSKRLRLLTDHRR